MAPRTVLYLTPSSRLLGARRSLLQLVANLDPERYRPVVVSQRPGDLVDALRDAGVATHVLFMGWWRKARYWPLLPWRIARLAALARREGTELIHCNEFHSNPYGVLAAYWAGRAPVVTHMRLSITPRQIRQYLLRRAARVVAVSQAAARLFDVWPDARERVEVVYNGVDLKEFRSGVDKAEARRRLALRAEDFVVGQFGLVSARKRPHLLVRAAGILRSALPNLRVLIVGSPGRSDATYERDVRTAARELGEVVRFVPFTSRVADVYRACDVNVLVSSDEGFGRTIIEAGALGIPSIGARTGGIPELIEEAKTGCLVPSDDDGGAALAACIGDLARNPARCRALGEAARAHIEARFSIQRHAAEIMRVYDQVRAGA